MAHGGRLWIWATDEEREKWKDEKRKYEKRCTQTHAVDRDAHVQGSHKGKTVGEKHVNEKRP
jgi:hypothetical protein